MREMSKTKEIVFSVISGLAIVGTNLGFGLGFGLPKKDSDGVSNTDTTSYTSVGELWNANDKNFNKENLDALFSSIIGVENANILDIDTIASSTATATDIRTNNGGKDIVVRLGGLDWQVMYLSKDSDGNAIATLWLSNNYQDAFKGRSQTEGLYHGYYKGGLYSDWSADWYTNTTSNGTSAFYPCAMYGTSYMRAVTLNNGGVYATSNTALTTATKNTNNIFAPFTMSTDGENNDLTDFIVTPSKVSWQKDQSAKTILGESHNYPNDAWNTATSDTGFFSSAINYAEHNNYDQWANDYLWLPSITETGYDTKYTGLWKPSINQRMNYNGSGTSLTGVSIGTSANVNYSTTVSNYSWLRSGYNVLFRYGVLSLYSSGDDSGVYDEYYSQAVRPALHLNLDLAYLSNSWIGHADSDWEGGGTKDSPYLISTAEELAGIAYNVNTGVSTYSGTYFKQTANIDLSKYYWTSIGDDVNPFKGYYDGCSFSIKNMKINTDKARQGLFGCTLNASISNIKLYNIEIFANQMYVGGIVGALSNSSVSNCSVDGYINVENDETQNQSSVGGIVGRSFTGSQVSSCSFSGVIQGSFHHMGGIVGRNEGSISNCHNTGNLFQQNSSFCGGIVGSSFGGEISYCTSDGYIYGYAYVGSIAGKISNEYYVETNPPKISNCAAYGVVKSVYYSGGIIGQVTAQTSIANCSFVGLIDKVYAFSYNNENISLFEACYSYVNGVGYYTSGDFSGYTIVNNMNDGLPIQNNLYAIAIGGYTSEEVIADLQNKGFALYS